MTDTKKPHYHGHRDRLRDKLVNDSRTLADYELLELLLAQVFTRMDTKPVAKAIMEKFGSLKDAIMARPDQITEIKGLGPKAAAQWTLMQELFARLAESQIRNREILDDPTLVAKAAMARIGSQKTEEFWAAFLNSKNGVIAWERMSKGTINATPVFPREILGRALKLDAASIILAHNHPGGDPRPSREDILLTDRIKETAAGLDIRILDHLVVTDMDYYSFNENGYL